MAANKAIRLGPVALTTTAATNVWNPPTTTGGVGTGTTNTNTYYIIRHIRATNTTGTAATVTINVGTTGIVTLPSVMAWYQTTVPANSAIDWYGALRLDVADFLVASSQTTAAITLTADAEIGLA
jgi:hypothetical protein